MLVTQNKKYENTGPITIEDAVLNIIDNAVYNEGIAESANQRAEAAVNFIAAILATMNEEQVLEVLNNVSYSWEKA